MRCIKFELLLKLFDPQLQYFDLPERGLVFVRLVECECQYIPYCAGQCSYFRSAIGTLITPELTVTARLIAIALNAMQAAPLASP